MHITKEYLLCEAFGLRGYPGVSEVVIKRKRVKLVDDEHKTITAKIGPDGRVHLRSKRKHGEHPSAQIRHRNGRWHISDMDRPNGHQALRLIPAN